LLKIIIKDINELKKAFQIINKRINNVCKRITPVPPWINKFQVSQILKNIYISSMKIQLTLFLY